MSYLRRDPFENPPDPAADGISLIDSRVSSRCPITRSCCPTDSSLVQYDHSTDVRTGRACLENLLLDGTGVDPSAFTVAKAIRLGKTVDPLPPIYLVHGT